jgi:NAD(P)-dependent dehydrogenase (short-subunit alcohol dehydrogenase family)
VAGGSAGIGRAAARLLAERGLRVAVLARGADRVRAAENELKSVAPDALGVVCDVSDADAVLAAAERIEAELGPIEVWVNAAMLTAFSRFDEMAAAEFESIVDTTLLGAVNGTRAALTVMRPRWRGRIVNVGSGLAYRSVPMQSAYCAAKHGVVGFTASLRSELIREKSGITLSMVQLPAVNTPQFDWARNRMANRPQPAPPIYAPEVAARAIMRAVDTGGREYFVGKSVLKLVFGDMFFPGWLDRKLAHDGVEAQKSGDPEPGDRPDNLHGPVSRDVAAAGRFEEEAKGEGTIVDADRARLAVLASIFGLGLILGGAAGAAF